MSNRLLGDDGDEVRLHYVWPDGDIVETNLCTDDECTETHYVIRRESGL